MSRRHPSLPLAAVMVAAFSLWVTAAAAAATPAVVVNGPKQTLHSAAADYDTKHPGVSPSGANDWACRPTPARPRPVVLLHGTTGSMYEGYAYLSPALKAQGFCVFALNYGNRGSADMTLSAKEVSTFVDSVLTETGARQVDLVGHSQGGPLARQYLRFEGGANVGAPDNNKVRNLVTLGATHNGSTFNGLTALFAQFGIKGSVAQQQQNVGSPFLTTLNAGGYTMPGVHYTLIATEFDTTTTPYQSTFFAAGPDATVDRVTLQTSCGIDFADHTAMVYGARTLWFVLRGLDAQPAGNPPCLLRLPLL